MIENKRILLLHRGDKYIRGTEVCLIKFAAALVEEGAEIFLACNNPDLLSQELDVSPLNVKKIPLDDIIYAKRFWRQPYLKHWVQVAQLALFCRANSIDIIYASGGAPAQFAAHIKRYLKLSLSIFTHFHHPATTLYYKSWGLSKSDLVVCPSQYTSSELMGIGVKAQVVYNGVHMPELPGGGLDDQRSMPQLCFVGHLEPNKRVDWLLKASKILKSKGHQFHLDIIGTGSQLNSLQGLADELRLGDVVTFHGRVDSVYEFMSKSDFHVMPSDVEGLGISVIEAAFCGTPSIVSASTGLLEVVEDGVTGWYFDALSLDALVDTLEQRLLADDNDCYGERAREFAIKHFSEQGYQRQMITALEQLL